MSKFVNFGEKNNFDFRKQKIKKKEENEKK